MMRYKTAYVQELRNELVDGFIALLNVQKIDREYVWTDVDCPAVHKAVNDFESVLTKIKRL